jgi:acyl-homoserine lactone synthase
MIHIVREKTRHIYSQYLDALYRDRYAYYVQERGWTELARGDDQEIDEFDDERAFYFLAFADDRRIMTSSRLRPTDDKSLLQSKFSHLVMPGTEMRSGANIWEWTRFFVAPEWRGPKDRVPRDELKVAVFEAAIRANVEYINIVCDTFFLPGLRGAGWTFRHLGPPAAYPGGEAMAIEVRTRPDDLDAYRERLAMHYPCLFDIGDLCLPPKAALDPIDLENFIQAIGRCESADARAVLQASASLNLSNTQKDLKSEHVH